MDTNSINRLIARLSEVAKSVSNLERIADTFNGNFVSQTKMIEADIERNRFKPIDPKAIKPRFDLETEVVINNEMSIWDGWRGKIVSMDSTAAEVRLENGTVMFCEGSQMIPLNEKPVEPEHICIREYCSVCRDEENQVEDANQLKLPALVDDAKIGPNKFLTDDQGRLTPPQWRANLGMLVVITTGLDDTYERQLMTEEAFRIYNAGLYTTKVVDDMKKEQF